MNIVKGHIYRGKKPRFVGPQKFYNDRLVLQVTETRVHFDYPTATLRRKYHVGRRKAFEKWAGKDVTKGYPEGTWKTKGGRA